MNISHIRDCYGCGLCSTVCVHKIIDIRLNSDGFFEPVMVNPSACTECGMCVSVCAYDNDISFPKPLHSYAAWSNNPDVRKKSTSGGVSTELAHHFILQGYKFCGVRYNSKKNQAEHFIAENFDEVNAAIGSKYLQSFTQDAFKKINRKEKYIVVGTPCQIGSFRRYIQKFRCECNFILVDFFCHGVPSKLMWDKYLSEHQNGIGKIIFASWRNKQKGWRNSYCITLEGESGMHQSWNGTDDFFAMFLGDACLGKACYDKCKFKYSNSSADIRIGDFWSPKYEGVKEGICAVIAFTEKGIVALRSSNLHLEEQSFDDVAEGQMRECAKRPMYYGVAMKILHSNQPLSRVTRMIQFYKKVKWQITKVKRLFR